ncbi:hypothetical protein QQ045_011560 [Rhodiola kirilowii]
MDHSVIEFTGSNRLDLMSEVSVMLTNLICNVVNAEVWTPNSRKSSVDFRMNMKGTESKLTGGTLVTPSHSDSATQSSISLFSIFQMKTPTIDSFFKRKTTEISEKDSHDHAPKLRRLEIEDDFDIDKLERDPGLRPQIWKYPIDSQLQELNNRFNDDSVELIILSSALDPKELRTTLRVDDICKLVEKFYPLDFDEDERTSLRMELQHFELVRQLPEFNTLTEISELCRWLMRTRKSNMFPLLYKVITLILTLPVSTATAERSFSRMNIVKNALRNKMEDDFLSDCLVVNIEKEIAKMFSTDSIIDDFHDLETRRSLF